MASCLCRVCTCLCVLALLVVLGQVLFTVGYAVLVGNLLPARAEDTVLSQPFNDGGCELVGEDLIRGGNSLALWKDGVAIVSAGDLNTTFRHYSQGARGVGLFAVDLKAGPKPAVRKLELLDWPTDLPPLVGQGLFISNASGRLYVVNHGTAREEPQQEEHDYMAGDHVQGLCGACEGDKWSAAVIEKNLGGGSYLVRWHVLSMSEVVLGRQLRRPKVKSSHEKVVYGPDLCAPSANISQKECWHTLDKQFRDIGHVHAVPFLQYLDDEPPGCFVHMGVHTFNLHPTGQRRSGRAIFCKRAEVEYENEERMPIGLGYEEELPESFVEVFEVLGEDFGSLRLRHVEHIGSDQFPYQSISQVAEGRDPSEIFVLRELPWRSTMHEHNLVEGSRNVDAPLYWVSSLWYWYCHMLGLHSMGRSWTWFNHNSRRVRGVKRYKDMGPAGGDMAVVRCKRLERRKLADQGVPVLGGLRWTCARTTVKGLPVVRGFAMGPDRSELLLGIGTRVARYGIREDGDLVEVGLPLSVSGHGWVTGLAWEEPGRVHYTFQPASSLLPLYRLRFLQRPGLPAELAVGKPPGDGRVWWLSNFLAGIAPSPAPVVGLLRHDGSLLGGHVSSWVRHGGAVLMGSDWEEGLLYCPQIQPAAAPDIRIGDRVWAHVDFEKGANDTKLRLGIEGIWTTLGESISDGGSARVAYQNLTAAGSLAEGGPRLGYDVIFRHKPHPVRWRMATVVGKNKTGYEVRWDEELPKKPASVLREAWRLQVVESARQPVRQGELVMALHAKGRWEHALIEQDHGDGNVTVSWDEEVQLGSNLRRILPRDELVVRFALPNSEPVSSRGCRGHCFADTGAAFGPQLGGRSFGWVPASGGLDSVTGSSAGEGSCSANYTSEGGHCSQPASGKSSRTTWEMEVPNGFYEATLVFLEGGDARAASCTIEGRPVEGTGVASVRVTDGRLTLGGCRGLLLSLLLQSVPPEEAMSTPFFHAPMGVAHSIGRFETHRSVERTDGRLLRRIPAGLTADNVTIVATVRGGSCGPRASVRFQIDEATLRFFQHGEQANWRPLLEVRELSGGFVDVLPTRIWTGSPGNDGWIVGGDLPKQAFSSSYVTGKRFEFCNGRKLTGGETVTLSFLAGPPLPADSAAEKRGPLQVGDRAELTITHPGIAEENARVTIKGIHPDGTFSVQRDGTEAEERRIPLDRARRTEEAGYRRHLLSNTGRLCNGRSSWTPEAKGYLDCLRLCSARPLCRFVAFLPLADLSVAVSNCVPSTECSEIVDAGSEYGDLSIIYEKLDLPIRDLKD